MLVDGQLFLTERTTQHTALMATSLKLKFVHILQKKLTGIIAN